MKTKNNKTKNNRTKKITINSKQKFINSILKEWSKQTNGGSITKDNSKYKNDYYLSFTKNSDYYYHIHLILHKFNRTHSKKNNIQYILKKLNKRKIMIVHSQVFNIDIFSDPASIVKEMIKNYKLFRDY